jgi:hypothetical protein
MPVKRGPKNFEEWTGLQKVKSIGESASAYYMAGTNYPMHFKRIICLSQQAFNLDETGLFWKKFEFVLICLRMKSLIQSETFTVTEVNKTFLG